MKNDAYVIKGERNSCSYIKSLPLYFFCLPRAKQKRFCHITDSQMGMFCNVHSETAEDSDKSFNSIFLIQEIISLEAIAPVSTRNPSLVF